MKKSARIAGLLYFAIVLTDVISLAVGNEAIPAFLKPFLMPSLAVAALCALLPKHWGKLTLLMIIGLLFHTSGDVLLLMTDRGFIFFALGLASFLIGHMFYLAVLCHGMGKLKGWKEIIPFIVPIFMVVPAALAFKVSAGLTTALAAYGYSLLAVSATGVIWAMRGRKLSWRIIVGGVVFLFSDIFVALNSLLDVDFFCRHAMVMFTYLVAEWFLVSTMTRWILKEK